MLLQLRLRLYIINAIITIRIQGINTLNMQSIHDKIGLKTPHFRTPEKGPKTGHFGPLQKGPKKAHFDPLQKGIKIIHH